MRTTYLTTMVAAAMLIATGCASAPKGEAQKDALQARSLGALAEMKALDPALNDYLNRSYGYAIFPSVGSGGFIVAGGYGRGEVYEQGRFIGFADITQATVGLTAGGQTFSELIVFKDQDALNRFKFGKVKLAAGASAVAVKAGAAATANYSDGVTVFTLPVGGLMVDASIGGQEFGFVPATDADRQNRADNQGTTGNNRAAGWGNDAAAGSPAASGSGTTPAPAAGSPSDQGAPSTGNQPAPANSNEPATASPSTQRSS